jgi:hypothetical protein
MDTSSWSHVKDKLDFDRYQVSAYFIGNAKGLVASARRMHLH